MSPLSVVKYFNIFKHSISCFCSCLIGLMFDTLLFHCSKETLHKRIIITIPFSAHAHLYLSCFEHGQIALTRILTSSIRVMDQTRSWLALAQRHFCRFCDQFFVSLLAHGPSHDQSRVDIHNGCQIEPAFCCANAGNICYPFGIGCISRKISLEQIWGDGIVVLTIRRFHLPSPRFRVDPSLTHQTSYPFSPTMHSLRFQFCVHTWASIDLTIVLIRIFDSLS